MNAEPESITCRGCRQPLPATSFHQSNRSATGRMATCRECRGARRKQLANGYARKRRGPVARPVPGPRLVEAPDAIDPDPLSIAIKALRIIATGRRDGVDCGLPDLGPDGLRETARRAIARIQEDVA